MNPCPPNRGKIKIAMAGYKRILGGQLSQNGSDIPKPRPTMAPPANAEPSVGALTLPAGPPPVQQQQRQQPARNVPQSTPARAKKSVASAAAPGFGQ